MTKIITYLPEHQDSIAELITTIQQKEFGVPITLQDQPDLLDIDNFYRQKNGNFWCAPGAFGACGAGRGRSGAESRDDRDAGC